MLYSSFHLKWNNSVQIQVEVPIFGQSPILIRLEIFALLTCIFLLIRFFVTLINFISKPCLPVVKNNTSQELVSILVPARNEAQTLPLLFESIQLQEYQNFELLILDDASGDDTALVVKQFAAKESRCRLITGKPLPAGWLGKNWACHQLSAMAKGEYLLFVDADVVIRPGFIVSALHQMKNKQLSLLSVFNDQVMLTAGEKMVVPLMHYLLLTLLPLHLVYTTRRHQVAAASGQCMLFNAAAYHTCHFHKAAKNEVTEDIVIMQQVKKAGLKGAALLANGLICCRMYHSFEEGITGFSKNFLSGFGNNIWAGLLFIWMVTISYFTLFTEPVYSLFASKDHFYLFLSVILLLILAIRIMVSVLSNQPVRVNLILHPLQMATLFIILVLSIYKRITNTNQWKGRLIPTQ